MPNVGGFSRVNVILPPLPIKTPLELGLRFWQISDLAFFLGLSFGNVEDFLVNYPTAHGGKANKIIAREYTSQKAKDIVAESSKSWAKLTIENAYVGKVDYALPAKVSIFGCQLWRTSENELF